MLFQLFQNTQKLEKKWWRYNRKIGQAGGVVAGWSRYWYSQFYHKGRSKDIFLVASVEERAERRFKENQEKGLRRDFETFEGGDLNVGII